MLVFVVLNPAAGRARADAMRKSLSRHFASSSWQLEIYETTGQEDVAGIVSAAIRRGFETIFAAGGDGTVSAVIDGLVNTGIPLGIIPGGTGNVLAQELGIPLNVDKACQMLAGKKAIRAIDALQVGERYFVLSVGTGLDALTIQSTDREVKRRFGPLAYVWSAAKVLTGIQPHVFTIVADGKRKRVRAADVLITNVGTLTRPLRWGSHIHPDDGQVDICIMRARNLGDIVGVARDIIVPGRPRRERNLSYWSARHTILVFAEQPLPVQGDGELLGNTPIEAQVLPGAIEVLVPA